LAGAFRGCASKFAEAQSAATEPVSKADFFKKPRRPEKQKSFSICFWYRLDWVRHLIKAVQSKKIRNKAKRNKTKKNETSSARQQQKTAYS
jgi:hypothetical protein